MILWTSFILAILRGYDAIFIIYYCDWSLCNYMISITPVLIINRLIGLTPLIVTTRNTCSDTCKHRIKKNLVGQITYSLTHSCSFSLILNNDWPQATPNMFRVIWHIVRMLSFCSHHFNVMKYKRRKQEDHFVFIDTGRNIRKSEVGLHIHLYSPFATKTMVYLNVWENR